uniref:G-protein coupled receptors family 1 profile domain-containing protein n=1 Tax=Ditylenchus dipsaci TaxID=166011 RepID=A0A915DD16_9BILA
MGMVSTVFSQLTVKGKTIQDSILGPLIREVYPSLNEPDSYVFVLTAIFLAFFIVGVCGNVATLCLVFGFGTPYSMHRKYKLKTAAHWSDENDRLKFYLAALSITDIFTLLGLPSAMVDSLIGFWIFNTNFCKFHHFCNTVGRISPAFVILDVKSNKPISSVVVALSLIAFLFCFQYWYMLKLKKYFYSSPIDGMSIVNIRKNQAELPARNVKAVKRVLAYIIMISMFYFICWLPYWCSVLYVSYVDLFESRVIKKLTNGPEPTILLLYFAHVFPYFHATANWLLYSRMCTQLTTPTNTFSSKEYLTERTSTAVEAGFLSTMLTEEPNEEVNCIQLGLENIKNNNHSVVHNVTTKKTSQICYEIGKSSSTGVEAQITDEIHLLSAEALLLTDQINKTISI